jgi:hypothetical protein
MFSFATLPRFGSLDEATPPGAMLSNRSKVTPPIDACTRRRMGRRSGDAR